MKDVDSAQAAVAAGYSAVAPIIRHLLMWLQDAISPVIDVLSPFLADIGAPLVPDLRFVFGTRHEPWKHGVLTRLVTVNREAALAMLDELQRLVTNASSGEIDAGVQECAARIFESVKLGR